MASAQKRYIRTLLTEKVMSRKLKAITVEEAVGVVMLQKASVIKMTGRRHI